ncbi:MAG: hypothetical protein A3D94_18915 [Alphaproteobacteria bacterium RIFCSPHIGHO2_12_FULL_66_14]|jgi:hypothetical protein|nr:MAG: hypothetical protein A3D94_18915 [Alphaproteobacteria bacterium RIFCSPHIGHO2_12_FULL_66_14]
MADQKLDADTILRKSVVAAKLNAVPLLVTALVLATPGWALWHPDIYEAAYTSVGYSAFRILLSAYGSIICSCPLYGAFQGTAGKRITIKECLSKGVGLAAPVLPLILILGLVEGLFSLLYIIPGFAFFVLCGLAIPIAIVERPGWEVSLSRSLKAASEFWPALTGAWGVILGPNMAVDLVCTFDEACRERAVIWAAEWLLILLSPILTILFSCAWAVAYDEIRRRKSAFT